MLSGSKTLKEFSLEASRQHYFERGPRWSYLHDSTIRSLILSLPSSLNTLTLDICGSRAVTPDRCRKAIHLCPLIAVRLPDFQNVRLRLRCICPEVLHTSSAIPKAESRLKTLVIRLSLPLFPSAFDETSNGKDDFCAKLCVGSINQLYKRMIAAGANSTNHFAGLEMMRISYRSQESPSRDHVVANCVRQYMFEPGGACYDEDQRDQWDQWVAWEDSEILQVERPFL